MTITEEQRAAAEKVVEVGRLLQHAMRQAERLGLSVSVSAYTSSGNSPAEVNSRVYLVDKLQVATSGDKKKK